MNGHPRKSAVITPPKEKAIRRQRLSEAMYSLTVIGKIGP